MMCRVGKYLENLPYRALMRKVAAAPLLRRGVGRQGGLNVHPCPEVLYVTVVVYTKISPRAPL